MSSNQSEAFFQLLNLLSEDIRVNRDTYNKEYSSLFAVARSTAHFVGLIQYISSRLTKHGKGLLAANIFLKKKIFRFLYAIIGSEAIFFST